MMRCFLLIFCLPILSAVANERIENRIANKCSASSIFRVTFEQADSIAHFDGEKLYLKTENIRYTNDHCLLHNGYSVIVLPRLSTDSNGYYLRCRSDDDFELECSNPDCGYVWWFTKEWSIYCPKCGSIGN